MKYLVFFAAGLFSAQSVAELKTGISATVNYHGTNSCNSRENFSAIQKFTLKQIAEGIARIEIHVKTNGGEQFTSATHTPAVEIIDGDQLRQPGALNVYCAHFTNDAFETVTTEAGTFETCKISKFGTQKEADQVYRVVEKTWIGAVPFGVVKRTVEKTDSKRCVIVEDKELLKYND